MSLYAVQKFLFQLNRSEELQQAYLADPRGELAGYELTEEETRALVEPDIGLLFHLGVNGQILMHFDRQIREPLAKELPRRHPDRRKGDALRAVGVAGQLTQLFEIVDRPLRLQCLAHSSAPPHVL